MTLFPETEGQAPALESLEWAGKARCKYDHALVTARLIPHWTAAAGWQVGWFAKVEGCVDEWHPAAPTKHKQHAAYPWYRLDELPTSNTFAVAAGTAARALKIVLEQMLDWAGEQHRADVSALQHAIERQAQDWLCGRAL